MESTTDPRDAPFDFLNKEADLAEKLIRIATETNDSGHKTQALKFAKEAVITIRCFLSRYPFTIDEIEKLKTRTNLIEQAIQRIEPRV